MNGARRDRAGLLAAAIESCEYTLSHRGENVSENMSEAVSALVNLRDRLIDEKRAGEGDPSLPGLLDRINSLISLAASLEYPLAGFQWKRIETIRDALQMMSSSESPSA
jgi:hypothetical protein